MSTYYALIAVDGREQYRPYGYYIITSEDCPVPGIYYLPITPRARNRRARYTNRRFELLS